MKKGIGIAVPEVIERRIILLRGQRVILDSHIAELYGVETKDLKRAVRRNKERFPTDFMVQVTKEESEILRCQFGASSWGGRRYRSRSQAPLGNAISRSSASLIIV